MLQHPFSKSMPLYYAISQPPSQNQQNGQQTKRGKKGGIYEEQLPIINQVLANYPKMNKKKC